MSTGSLITKKIFVMAFVLAAISVGTKAQVQISVGPGAGFNFAFHSFDDSNESVNHFGPLVTSQVDMQFSRSLGLLLWVDFLSNMSAKDSEEGLDGKFKINYLSISPTLKYCLPGSPLYVYAGPGIGFKTKGKLILSYEGVSMETDIPDTKVRIDARFGIGYDFFLMNKLTLSPFIGFNMGFTEVYTDSDWKINTLQAGIVLRYNVF